jgi:fumarate reductase subunit D
VLVQTLPAPRTIERPVWRLGAGITVLLGMWAAALVAVAIGLTAPLGVLDGADPRSGDTTFMVAVAVAVVLFLLSGPAACVVSRRRALLAAPAGLLLVWVAGIGLAAVT